LIILNESRDKEQLDLANKISNQIRKIGKQLDQHERDLFRFHGVQGVTPPQLFILRIFWMDESEGGWSLKYLANLAKVSRATMTGIIDTMEKNGLVVRVPNLKDKRSMLVKITKKGEDLKRYKPPIDRDVDHHFSSFTLEELKFLQILLDKLSKSMEIEDS